MPARLGDSGDEPAETHDINVTPFIDVTLVLLIIFMVAAPLATVDLQVDLPSSAAQTQPRPDKPIYLTLAPDLSLFLGDTKIARDSLPALLDEASAHDRAQRVFLRADKTAPYGEVMAAMEALRSAGYLKVALVAQEATP